MVLHVRYEGRSFDVDFRQLGLAGSPGDTEVRQALARHLDVKSTALNGHVIDRAPNGNLVLRPEAVYG